MTNTDTAIAFVKLLVEASDDGSALNLCVGLPTWFQIVLRDTLDELAATNYYRRWFAMGDTRTSDEIHNDALRHQEVLVRLAPRINGILADAPS